MSFDIGLNLPAIEKTARSGVEAPPNSPVSIQERFAAAVAELPMPYGEGELDSRLDDAIKDGNLEALKLLLDCGVKPDATHLRFAIYRDNREAAELLLERGVDPNGLWQHKHHVEKIIPYMELLVSHGADVSQFTAQHGPEINALALEACAAADVDRVKALIICGADVNHCDDEDVSLLHITWRTEHHPDDQEQQAAVKRAKTAIVRLLCENGADPAKNVDERFALWASIIDAPGAIAICLLAHGLFKNFAPWRANATSDRPGNIVHILLRQLSVAGRVDDAKSLAECARVMDMLLACDVDIVKDTCAVALAQSMLGFGYAISKPVQPIIHEALCIYRNRLDGPPPIMVRRYFAKCRFPERLAAATRALAAVGLTAHASDHEPFTLKGRYSVREHGLLLLDLACVWATNPRRVGSHTSAILMYVWDSLTELIPQGPDDEKLISELNEAFELARIETSLSHPGTASVDPPPPDRPPA